MKTFDEAFEIFLEGARNIRKEHHTRCNFDVGTLEVEQGHKYIKLVSVMFGLQKSVWGFVNKTNGDVLKAASYNAPAKHARGNIFDAYNGLSMIGPYGPDYLKGPNIC